VSESEVPTQEGQSIEPTRSVVRIGEEEYPIEEVNSWKEAAAERKRTMADYTRKTQKLADERRALEEERGRLSQSPVQSAPPTQNGQFGQMDEYVPGLGGALGTVMAELREIKTAQAKLDRENTEAMKVVEREEAMETALGQFKGKPLANPEEMRSFLESRNLGPENADLAYEKLYGFKLGQLAKEEAMKRRNTDAKPPMKGGSLGIQGSVPQET
jgi:hypothetical protein